jgi:predicted  nucleic acid-binding Zn-ribbon protein
VLDPGASCPEVEKSIHLEKDIASLDGRIAYSEKKQALNIALPKEEIASLEAEASSLKSRLASLKAETLSSEVRMVNLKAETTSSVEVSDSLGNTSI